MSPLNIHILLEIYAFVRTDDCPYFKKYERIRSTFVEELVRDGLIKPVDPKKLGDLPFEVTRKGHVYIDAMCNTPMPYQDWVMPKRGENDI